jgi:hypothetical protein
VPRAFIVRPFGTKEGIDFDAVDQALIQPALKAAGVPGSTTANIAEAGNIREDMFRLLVTADLVVADLSGRLVMHREYRPCQLRDSPSERMNEPVARQP